MSQAPVMPMFVDAMLGDTLHLDSELFGAYHFILYAVWRANGVPLVDDDAVLCRVCRMTMARWKKARPVLAAFFDLSGGTWRQKRLEQEWAGVQERAERARENGMRGGRPRKPKNPDVTQKKPSGLATGNPTPNPDHNPNESSHILIQEGSTPPPSQTPSRAPERDPAVAAMVAVLDDAVREHFPLPRPSRHRSDDSIAKGWIERGVTTEQAQAVIEPMVGKAAANGDEAPFSLKYFLNAMERAIAAGRAGGAVPAASSDPGQESAARAYNDAMRRWADDGREGPAPRPEAYGLKPRKVAA